MKAEEGNEADVKAGEAEETEDMPTKNAAGGTIKQRHYRSNVTTGCDLFLRKLLGLLR